MGSTATIGSGATFLIGKATKNGESANITPWVIAGAALNAGVKEQVDRSVTTALTWTVFAGVSDIAVSYSHDVLDGHNFIGLSLKLDVLNSLAPDKYICLSCR